MIAQQLLSTSAVVVFLVISGKLLFSIPSAGVVVGLGLLLLIFFFWYFVLCHDFFKGGGVNFLNKIVPLALGVLFFVVIFLGVLKIVPWLPEGAGMDGGRGGGVGQEELPRF